MQIKIYRGTHRIGGCVTEIKTEDARIIIDAGEELPPFDGNAPLEIEGVTCGNAQCGGVFITHYHGDHAGMYNRILPSVPIYMGSAAKRIYSLVQRAAHAQNGTDFGRVETFKTYEAGKPICIADMKITPYAIDHSACDAYMFLVESGGKRALHTGDFRMHGARGRKMPEVFKKYARDIDALIIEGTMMSRRGETILTERQLGQRAQKILHDNKSVFVLCSSTNIDTIAEFFWAAAAENRMFIVCEDDYQSKILRVVSQNAKSSFYDFGRGKVYAYGKNLHGAMAERGFCFIGRTNRITRQALNAFSDNVLIYSMWTGYLNKSHPAYDEYKSSFVNEAVANGSSLRYLHTSGHASADQIRRVCAITGAKTIIPIHSEYPEAFYSLGTDGAVHVLQDGESITV